MKFLEKSLTASNSGEQVKQSIPCTFRAHAAALKSAATVKYFDKNGIDRTYFALNASLDPLFETADEYDDAVICDCLLIAGYRSGRDLTEFENALKTAKAAAAPLEKRADELNAQAKACGDADVAKHAGIMKELDGLKPELAAARDSLAKARAALGEEREKDIKRFMSGFEKRGEMLTAVSKWLYENAADRFGAIAQAADDAVRTYSADFAGRMLSYVDEIVKDDDFPLNNKGRRCSCGGDVEDNIIKAIKRPFNGGVGYRHTATGGTRYCDVPMRAGNEVDISKVTE